MMSIVLASTISLKVIAESLNNELRMLLEYRKKEQASLFKSWALIESDRRITQQRIADAFGISKERAGFVIQKLGYEEICVRWVPRMVTAEIKHQRKEPCEQLLEGWVPRMRKCCNGTEANCDDLAPSQNFVRQQKCHLHIINFDEEKGDGSNTLPLQEQNVRFTSD
ncbi:hypothetical protein QE152_g8084 [Popillia japonica]|uniref:Uncharacterized protein n=1 Tax=Popillia japonica TaxID=7064 RepID=A0AAW1M602_POPJA